jgi:metal-sulfur cluster biosynthetic enzyme
MTDAAPSAAPGAATPFAPATSGPYAERERLITENLKQIYDPEIPMNIVDKVPNVKAATVDMIWDPPWSPDRMSDFAKRQFGYA